MLSITVCEDSNSFLIKLFINMEIDNIIEETIKNVKDTEFLIKTYSTFVQLNKEDAISNYAIGSSIIKTIRINNLDISKEDFDKLKTIYYNERIKVLNNDKETKRDIDEIDKSFEDDLSNKSKEELIDIINSLRD